MKRATCAAAQLLLLAAIAAGPSQWAAEAGRVAFPADQAAAAVGGGGAAPLRATAAAPPPAAAAAAAAAATRTTTPTTPTTPKGSSWAVERKKRATECEESDFRASLLPMIKEMPFVGLFDDMRGINKFEASGMTVARGWLWVVFDNLHALGRVDEHFEFRDKHNMLVGELGDDSQFEGLAYVESTGRFFAVEEVADAATHGLHAYTHEIELTRDGTHYRTVQRCAVHFELVHENKGIEGLHYHEDARAGHKYLLGLCEGNFCEGGARGREAGNGRVVIAEFNGKASDEECGWDVVKVVEIPPAANFIDYSGMAFRGSRVAIVSQENSAMWIGHFDFDKLEFTDEGQVFNFPRDNHCDMVYCNVEGIQWLDDDRFVIASDKAKSSQPYRCIAKEQRLSIFALPSGTDLPPTGVDNAAAAARLGGGAEEAEEAGGGGTVIAAAA